MARSTLSEPEGVDRRGDAQLPPPTAERLHHTRTPARLLCPVFSSWRPLFLPPPSVQMTHQRLLHSMLHVSASSAHAVVPSRGVSVSSSSSPVSINVGADDPHAAHSDDVESETHFEAHQPHQPPRASKSARHATNTAAKPATWTREHAWHGWRRRWIQIARSRTLLALTLLAVAALAWGYIHHAQKFNLGQTCRRNMATQPCA